MDYFDPRTPLGDLLKHVVHPCDLWARGAKHIDWQSALQAMKEGTVLCGPTPRVGKSTIDLMEFVRQVNAEGLHSYSTDMGQTWLGLKGNFSPALLANHARDAELRSFTRFAS